MYEELYIIENGSRLKLDLSTPSGITLNYKSNIFGDLSKITCSYSYTFKLPMTVNNRRVLGCADDIRCSSDMIRRRLKAEYIQNGIPLFSNANLYIDAIESGFSAVMTWGVIDGFDALKNDDISIRDLDLVASPLFGPCDTEIGDYKNTADYLRPLYNAGLTYVSDNGWKDQYNTWSVFPLPVIPVYRLIELINSQYSTKFKFGSAYSYGEDSLDHEIIRLGVVPCVTAETNEEQAEAKKAKTYIGGYMTDSYAGISHVLLGNTNDPTPGDSSLYSLVKNSSDQTIGLKIHSDSSIKFEVDGCLMTKFSHEPNQYSGQGRVEMGAPSSSGFTPKLTFYATSNGSTATSLGSVEGKFSYDNNWWWQFDFAKERGKDRLSIEVPANSTIFCAIECDANNLQLKSPTQIQNLFCFYPTIDATNIQWNKPEAEAGSYTIDLMSNLPDISCMTLIKSLYFMMGAFPTTNADGYIVPIFYTDLKQNIIDNNIIDWSDRVMSGFCELPDKTSYSVSGFGQYNYYMMKSDSLEQKKSSDEESDVYASGIGCIHVQNEVIDKTKTIIQTPFNPPYLKNKKSPSIPTGETIKYWYYENDEVKVKEAKPCLALIKPLVQTENSVATGVEWMSLEVWNKFPDINSDSSYSYLSEIMSNPIVITEKLMLNEFDLCNLDYSVPVYLSKYNAFFAIVSITRDSSGICKCELIKLPEQE